MNINNKIKVNNSNEIELLEDAKKGDIIDLSTLNQVDISYLQKLINDKKDDEYKKMLQKELEQKNNEHRVEIERLKIQFEKDVSEEKDELKEKITSLNIEIEKLKKSKEAEIQLTEEKIKHQYENKISSIENEQKIIAAKYELEKEKEINRVTNLKDQEITNLKLELEGTDTKIKEAVFKKENELSEKIHELEAKNNQLLFSKSMAGIKDLGENLEQWCDNQYIEHSVYGFENCSWIKDNKAVEDEFDSKKTKGDFIFKVYADARKKDETLLTSALLDMKDKNPNSNSNNKNSDHYKKLDSDRRKKGCEYAILVSNLERDRAVNDAPVIKVGEYEKMYVVRPEYFMVFLSLLASLAVKYASFMTAEKRDLLNKEDAIKMFEDFKNDVLVKSFASLSKSIDEMLKKALSIQSSAEDIIDECRKIQDRTLERLKNKIEKFNISKAINSLD
jgi:hypothetical protein